MLRRLTTYNTPSPATLPTKSWFGVSPVRRVPEYDCSQPLYLPCLAVAPPAALRSRFHYSEFLRLREIDRQREWNPDADGDTLTPSNNYDLELDRGLSAFDFRRRWTNSWLYELPFGKGRRFMNSGGLPNVLLGGWQFGGILTFRTAFHSRRYAVRALLRMAAAPATRMPRHQSQFRVRGGPEARAILQHRCFH